MCQLLRSLAKLALDWIVILISGGLVAGVLLCLTGIGIWSDGEDAYKVEFAKPEGSCGSTGSDLYINIEDGRPLGCVSSSVHLPVYDPSFYPTGFSSSQIQEVLQLSERLGAGGLSDADQEKIQNRMDAIAASLPADDRPWEDKWGPRLFWWGVLLTAPALTALSCYGVVNGVGYLRSKGWRGSMN